MDRKRIPVSLETTVLMKGARRCPLCFYLHGDLSEKHGQIAHLDDNPANFQEDNLAFLCMTHHSVYDSTTSQHKIYTLHDIKAMRELFTSRFGTRNMRLASPLTLKYLNDWGRYPTHSLIFDQLRALPENPLLTKIHSLPQWRVSICPDEFMESQFQSLDQCERFVHSQTIRNNGYDYFPLMPLNVSAGIKQPHSRWFSSQRTLQNTSSLVFETHVCDNAIQLQVRALTIAGLAVARARTYPTLLRRQRERER